MLSWVIVVDVRYHAPELLVEADENDFGMNTPESIDMWAVCIMTFHLLTGELPFKVLLSLWCGTQDWHQGKSEWEIWGRIKNFE